MLMSLSLCLSGKQWETLSGEDDTHKTALPTASRKPELRSPGSKQSTPHAGRAVGFPGPALPAGLDPSG